MTRSQTDVSQAPESPQFQLGPTTDEAKMALQIQKSPLEGPGGIVQRLGQQFQLPRAGVDSEINRETHGED